MSDIHDLYEQYKTSSGEEAQNLPVHSYAPSTIGLTEWSKTIINQPGTKAKDYALSLFPVHRWILHYNLAWLYSDVVAGVTVGVVMVPQSMSYAQLAGLEAQYGLYSAFIGVFIYCFFATSKDVSIGPVAVMSLEVSKVIHAVQEKNPDLPGAVIATILSLLCGSIAFGIGILRLGFILEFISIPAVMGFMSGSAFSIIVGQVPALLGYGSLVNTREATFKVVINSLKHLPDTALDAVFGLIPLVLLYAWKFVCNWGPKRYPKQKAWFFYTQALRNGVILVVFTLISWGLIRHDTSKKRISILGTVPSGLKNVGLMTLPDNVLKDIAPEIPAATIILLLEHISISKSFGRINDYKIVPDQELIAIGVTNLIGTFFNAYPATGSFSRSALKAKCNVKTPLAGIYTGACVLLALYALTDAFYFIPKATLSAVIIHAVSDLIASYQSTFHFWKISPIDSGIFLTCVLITVFSSIENGIYFAICASVVILLLNIAFPNGEFMGRVKVAEVVNPEIIEDDSNSSINSTNDSEDKIEMQEFTITKKQSSSGSASASAAQRTKSPKDFNIKYHTKWVPYGRSNLHSQAQILPPPPGVLVFRPAESWTYVNCSRQYDYIFDEIKKVTKRGKELNYSRNIDRPWNEPGPLRWSLFGLGKKKKVEGEVEVVDNRPILKVFVFDFTMVNQVDSTSVQALIDLRKAVNKYADREVEFHFVGVLNPWIKRALVQAGFGNGKIEDSQVDIENVQVSETFVDVIKDDEDSFGYISALGTDTPFFHLDIPNLDYLDNEKSY
jgi:sodium-independent sulfate anion transporter 11